MGIEASRRLALGSHCALLSKLFEPLREVSSCCSGSVIMLQGTGRTPFHLCSCQLVLVLLIASSSSSSFYAITSAAVVIADPAGSAHSAAAAATLNDIVVGNINTMLIIAVAVTNQF
jgi:hypothetical protein